jgi:RNA polymerase sigma-70 factor (ECF subfamily)
MIAVARGVGRFDGRSRFSTWVYRVATNACLDELRRRSRRALPVDDLPDGEAPFVVGGPAGDMDDAELRLDVQDALLRLPLEFRAAVVLRDLCGLDYGEIATTLDIPVGTVRSRIARGRGALARILGGNRDETADRPTSQT